MMFAKVDLAEEEDLEYRFEAGTCFELHGFRSLDLNLFTGLWVDTGTGRTFGDGESAETDELNVFVLFDTLFDRFEHCFNGALCSGFGGVGSK